MGSEAEDDEDRESAGTLNPDSQRSRRASRHRRRGHKRVRNRDRSRAESLSEAEDDEDDNEMSQEDAESLSEAEVDEDRESAGRALINPNRGKKGFGMKAFKKKFGGTPCGRRLNCM